jgi:hypothetical protein
MGRVVESRRGEQHRAGILFLWHVALAIAKPGVSIEVLNVERQLRVKIFTNRCLWEQNYISVLLLFVHS